MLDVEGEERQKEDRSSSGKKLDRGFSHFILKPIMRLIRASLRGHDARPLLDKYLTRLKIQLSAEEEELEGKMLMKCIMGKFLPLVSVRIRPSSCFVHVFDYH